MKEQQMINRTNRGWVDLTNLVYSGNSVNWGMSIGKTVDFQFDDIVSTLTIVGRADNAQYVYIDIPGYVEHRKIYVGQIRHGQLGNVVGRITAGFKYKVGDIVNNLLITDMRKTQKYKYYSYICMTDGYQGDIREDHLFKKHGCPVCANKVVLKGCNDIATTNPQMAMLFYNSSDAFLYTEHANKYADFRCPRCGNKINARIHSVARNGLSCKKCGDGISYPNKFVYNFIEQLSRLYYSKAKNFEFTPEKIFSWSMNFNHENKKISGKKIYDMFIDTHNIIIENHGEYHYKDSLYNTNGRRSLAEVQMNDAIKKELAISNGIEKDNYIILDCRESDMTYIKKSIMSSILPELFGFTESDIDWNECNKFATSSRVYEACCYWNDGIKNCKTIASIMKMNNNTISRYIKKGRALNIITD